MSNEDVRVSSKIVLVFIFNLSPTQSSSFHTHIHCTKKSIKTNVMNNIPWLSLKLSQWLIITNCNCYGCCFGFCRLHWYTFMKYFILGGRGGGVFRVLFLICFFNFPYILYLNTAVWFNALVIISDSRPWMFVICSNGGDGGSSLGMGRARIDFAGRYPLLAQVFCCIIFFSKISEVL